MMSHKSRYRFDLMRILACSCTVAGVVDDNAACVRYVYCGGVVSGGCARCCCCCCCCYHHLFFTDFNISRDFTYVLLMLEIDDFI